MTIIGLAGGSASGKSTVAKHLVKRGMAHIDADAIGHAVLEEPAIRERVVDAFGPEILVGGRIDRARLGALVFADPVRLQQLNSTVHPRIVEVCAERVNALRGTGVERVVVDAALLLEVSMPFEMDLVIALRVDDSEQRRRLLADGVAQEQIDARLQSQRTLEAAFDRADVIVDANQPQDVVCAEIDRLIEETSRD